MQIHYCNNHIKSAYFELDSPSVATDDVNSDQVWLPYRVVGKHFIAIGEPFAVGLVAEDTFGQLWLYPNDSRDGLSYINGSIDMLRDACARWSNCRKGRDVTEFQKWLHAEDIRAQFQPLCFWNDRIGDALGHSDV